MIRRNALIFRRLQNEDHITAFNCGSRYKELNDFIRDDAQHYADAMLAVTYIVEDNGKTAAYFTMANDRIGIEDFGSNNQFNRFRRRSYENSKRIKHYPAVKLCRFAVDLNFKNSGLGTRLLNLIKYFFFEDNKSGCRYITVDARSDAVEFYEKNGFKHLYEEETSTSPDTEDLSDKEKTVLMYYDLIALKTN
jgi:GNAT superfamily N-acetyltransferase